jgi:4a-hydroxytetrahydrobiopterin dehydratase
MDLPNMKCAPCEAGTPPLGPERIGAYLPHVAGWQVVEDGRKITKRFKHGDFKAAMAFVNRMADLAEAEGHHPDITVRYNVVDVTTYTHSIGGLSENDFILAAKIDRLTT